MQAKVNGMTTVSNLPATKEQIENLPMKQLSRETCEQVKKWFAPKDATAADIAFFVGMAVARGLDIWNQDIYMIPFSGVAGRRYAPVVNYQVYLDRADQSGVWAGMELEFDDDDNPTKCTVTIYRKDWSRPGKRTTFLKDVIKMRWDKETRTRVPMALWATNLRQMLEKCSVVGALRFYIPACRRMPYIQAEVQGPEGYVSPQAVTAHVSGAALMDPNEDINYLRGQYFKLANVKFEDDADARHAWQEEYIGKKSIKDDNWTAEDFIKALDILEVTGLSAAEMEAELGKDDATAEVEVGGQEEEESTAKPEEPTATGKNGMDFDGLTAQVSSLLETTVDRLNEYTAGLGGTRAKVTLMLKTVVEEDPIVVADLQKRFAAWDAKTPEVDAQQNVEM